MSYYIIQSMNLLDISLFFVYIYTILSYFARNCIFSPVTDHCLPCCMLGFVIHIRTRRGRIPHLHISFPESRLLFSRSLSRIINTDRMSLILFLLADDEHIPVTID